MDNNTVEKKELTKEEKNRLNFVLALGLVGGTLIGAGLAYLGFAKFMKTDKAFDLCRMRMINKYPDCEITVLPEGIAIFGSDTATNAKKFLAGWACDNKEIKNRLAERILADINEEA